MKSQYGSHYRVAIDVFNNYKFTGVGLKNYRIEVMKKGYSENPSIHPHQVHFEILSETGLIGYISFLLLFIYSLYFSINNFFSTRNIYQLSGILFVFISLLPVIPSGSFFTSFGATLFWLNYGLIIPNKKILI
jgi:O-antigen ligase